MTDYSQGGEQAIILELLKDKPRGRLLDIGAYDGTTFSNTRALIEEGWSGVLAEPEPAAFLRLFDLYKDHPGIKLVNAAVGETFYLTRFWRTADLVSTLNEHHHERWRNAAAYDGTYYVVTVPVGDLYRMAAPDFVNVDIEGDSAHLAMGMILHGMLPRVYCVEHDSMAEDLIKISAPCGYREAFRNAENLILARA